METSRTVASVRRPPTGAAVAVSAALVALWGWLHLGLAPDDVVPLTYAVPLLVGLWHRRPWLLWSMAGASLVLVCVKMFWMLPQDQLPLEAGWTVLAARAANIGITSAVIHVVVNLRARLEATNVELETANEEIASQNEELRLQSEELAQQNEELQTQAEEMEQQAEELQSQTEELQTLNAELGRRESMLQSLLEATRSIGDEDRALAELCRAAVDLMGDQIAAVSVVERRGEQLRLIAQTGLGVDGVSDGWPVENSFAAIVLRQDRTAFLEDVLLRPDLAWHGAERPFRSVLAAPLRLRGSDFGVMKFYSPVPRRWTDEQFRLAEWVAAQCAMVMDTLRLQVELRATSQRLQFHIDNSPLAVVEWNADGRILRWTREAERIFGWSAAEVVGRVVHDMSWIHQDDSFIVGRLMQDMVAGRRFQTVCLNRNYRKDGSVAWCEWYNSALRDENGRVVSIMSLALDVTARKQAEEDLKAAKQSAESANAAKDEFLAVLSHELRTPLAPVLLTISLLERRDDLPEEVRSDIQMIRRSVQLESRIIDDLLDLTRISRGKLQFDMRPADLHTLVQSAVDVCAHGDGARIVLDLAAEGHFVCGDAGRLQQVFWNLLNNARKFTPADGTITVRSRELPGGRVRVEVQDTGDGIEATDLPRLFSAFEQGSAGRARKFGGLGLGLAISKAIVDAHAGKIWAESDGKGRGARFVVELDIVAETPIPAPCTLQTVAPRGLSILLVEDHEPTLKVLRRLVQGLGHEVQTANCVAAAKEVALVGRFDLVISDLGLPDGTGHDLMRWLKERWDLRGLALSGYGMEGDLRQSREAGFEEHLIKPVDMHRLEEAIGRVAGGWPPPAHPNGNGKSTAEAPLA